MAGPAEVPLILASGSPRRRELLARFGLAFTVCSPGIDESPLPGEGPVACAARLARAKGQAVAAGRPDAVVLAADTCVFVGPQVFDKPRDPEEAVRTLRALSGREHSVATAVFVTGPRATLEQQVVTRVLFRPVTEAQARWYVATGEPMDKAGAYAIQGRGGAFVESLHGSASNVVGLPLAEALDLLRGAGLVLPWDAP